MATLSKHGELGQIERVAYKIAYCADGNIMRNQGDGWKRWKRLKPGVEARAHYEKRLAEYGAKLRENPAFAEWRTLFHELVSFKHRSIVLTTISLMPQDPDGCWSTFDDYSYMGIELSIEDCVQLCRAYEAAQAEARDKKATQVEATAHPV